jgi:hypothetical protein
VAMSSIGCLAQIVVAVIIAIVIAFLVYHLTNPPHPAHSSSVHSSAVSLRSSFNGTDDMLWAMRS